MNEEEPSFWKKLYANRNDERVVEYRYVFRALRPMRLDTMNVLDVGCLDSQLAEALSRMGYVSTGIDIREYPTEHSFKFIRGDIRKTEFADNSFDQIACISTVEHVGLNAYGNQQLDPHGDKKAILEMKRILKSNGNLILTVPFGRHPNDYWIRYYNPQTLKELIAPLSVVDQSFYYKPSHTWIGCIVDQAAKMDVGSGGVPLGCCCMTLTK